MIFNFQIYDESYSSKSLNDFINIIIDAVKLIAKDTESMSKMELITVFTPFADLKRRIYKI
jgi:hypothetical protein